MGDKDNFQSGIEQRLRQWNTQNESASQTIAALKEQVRQLKSEAQPLYLDHNQELENKIATAKGKIDEGQQRLDSFKAVGEEIWNEIKTGGQQAWGNLALGLNEAWDSMKTSIEQVSSKTQDRIPKK
jgi:uncharacterized coiled-coil DUF342 family protein